MVDFVLSLQMLHGASAFMLFTAATGTVIYFCAHRLIFRQATEDIKAAATNTFRVVGILVSLFLSLTFADVILELNSIETAIQGESLAIADIYDDLRRFDVEGTRETRLLLIEYAQAVIEDDWPALAQDRLGERAEGLLRSLETRALGLVATNPAQETLRGRIIHDIDRIPDYRLIRLGQALAEPPFFMIVVVSAYLVTMVCFGAHLPSLPVLTLVALYTLLVGLVFYLILGFSDPFQGATSVDPAPIEYVLEQMRSQE